MDSESDLEGPDVGAKKRIFCNTCKVNTQHELKAIQLKNTIEIQGEPWEDRLEEQFRFWVCQGCDTALLELTFTYAKWLVDPDTGEIYWRSELYPKRMTSDLVAKHFIHLSSPLQNVYNEVIESFNGNLRILCAIGLRTLLEGVCAQKEISGRNLYKKIEGLKEFLPNNIVESLHGFRFMGNDATHDLKAPERRDLQLAIDVIEDILNFLYELEYKAQKLPDDIPF